MSAQNYNNDFPEWLDGPAIETAIQQQQEPETAVVRDVLDKSLALEPLGLDEIVALLRIRDVNNRKLVRATADQVKQKVYGDRIVLTAPLHLSNHCASDCLYCSAHKGNSHIQRKRLDKNEIRAAGKKLLRQGHKRIILTLGQLETVDVDYLANAITTLYRLFEGPGEIRRINVNAGTLSKDEFTELAQADPGAALIYQETYHQPSYKAAHTAGPKSDYSARINSPDIALTSGIKDVGLGLCLGLGPWDYDILALSRHAAHLAHDFGVGSRNINLHRCRPAPGCTYIPPYSLNDADFLHCVAVVRLAIPYTGLILTTKEPSGLWKDACSAGCSQLLTGSLANPYESWVEAPHEKTPFPIGEETHLDEVVRFLLEDAEHLPSFCTACPRLGRNGGEFISMVSQGDIKSQCGPNSLASFMEFLLNYATPYTRQLGEKLINDKIEQMNEHERGASERLLQKVRSGRMDEFI